MPLYDYDCANCGERFEVLRGVHADQPTTCPLCGGGPVKKAFAAPAIHFKGTGWAKKERRATSSPGSSKPKGDDSSSDSTSEPKTAAKDGGSGSDATSTSSTSAPGDTASSSGTSSTPASKGSDRASKPAATKD